MINRNGVLLAMMVCVGVGCASSEAIYNNFAKMVNTSDGIDQQEAKIIAQNEIIKMYEKRDYRVTAPDIKTTHAASKYPDYWFIIFGHNWFSPMSTDPMAKTYTQLREAQYLVVINKANGDIKFSGQWFPKRTDDFDWVFHPDHYSKERALGLSPGEAGNPIN